MPINPVIAVAPSITSAGVRAPYVRF